MTAALQPRATWEGRAVWQAGLIGLGVSLTAAVVVTALYVTVPRGNRGSGPVDALLVLGTPAGLHGELTEMERWRVDEAVREFVAGRAPRIVLSGGPTSHGVYEADVMARYARAQGVPAADILEERHSFTTLQNIRNSAALLKAHGWGSVEVISTAEHLPRAAVLLGETGLLWRVQSASTPGRGRAEIGEAYLEEAVGTAVLRLFGTRAEPVLHALSIAQHRVAWALRWVLYKAEARLSRRSSS